MNSNDVNADEDLRGNSLSPTPSDLSDWDLEVVDSISGSSEDYETMDEVNDVENDDASCPASDDKSIPSEDVLVISGSSQSTFVESPAVETVDEDDDDSDTEVLDSVAKSSDSETFNDILKKLEQLTENSSDSSSDGWFDEMIEEAPEIEDSPLLTKEIKVEVNDEIIQSEIEDVEHETDSNVFELELKPKTEISNESSEGCEIYKIIERSSTFPVSDGCNFSCEENVDTKKNELEENSGTLVVNESRVSKETENAAILVTVTTETTCQLVKHPDSFDEDCQAIKSIIDRLILQIIVDTTVSELKREIEPTVTPKTSCFELDREIGMSSEVRNDPKVPDTLPKYKAFSNDEKIKTSEPTELANEQEHLCISVDKRTESTAELDVLSNTEMEGSSLCQVMDSVLTPVKSIICKDLENKAVVESHKEIECPLPAKEELHQNLNTNGTDILISDGSFHRGIRVINAKRGDPKSEDSDNNSLNVSEVDSTDSSRVIFSEAVAERNDNSSLFPIIESISFSEMAVSNVDLEEPDVPDYSPKRKLVEEPDEMPNKKCKLDIIQPSASKELLDNSKEDQTSDSPAIDQKTCDADCEVDNSIEPPKEGSGEVLELYEASSDVLNDVKRLKNDPFFIQKQNSAISDTNYLNGGWRMKAETLFSQNFTDSHDVETVEPATLHSQNDNSTDSDSPLLQKDMLDDIIKSLNSPKASTSNSDSEHQPVEIDKMAPCSLDTEIPSFNKESTNVESTKERDVLATEVEAKGDTESDICVIQEKAVESATTSKQEEFNKDNYLELSRKDLSRFFDELVSSVFNRVFSLEILAAEREYRAASDALRKITVELDDKIQQICKLCDKQKAMFEHFNYKPVIERRNVGVNVRSVQPSAKHKVLPKSAPVQRQAPKFVGQPQVPINPLENAKPIIISSPQKPLIRSNVKSQMLSTPASSNAQIIRGKIPPNATVVQYPVPNTRPALLNAGKVPASFQLPPGSSVIYRKEVPTALPRPRTVVPTAGQAKLCLSPTRPGVTSFGIQVPRLAGNVMPIPMQYFPRTNTNTALIPSNMAAIRSGPNTRFVVLSSQGPQFRVLTPVALSNLQKVQRPQSIPVTPTVSQSISKLAINPNQGPPPLPRAHYPENPAFKLLPPKPLFGLSKKTDGIHLTWNLNVQADHEEIAKYELFAYQENEPAIKSDWRNIGDIKAMALPMACTLTQFISGHRYYFAVRAVDRYGRAGEFSDPRNIKITA